VKTFKAGQLAFLFGTQFVILLHFNKKYCAVEQKNMIFIPGILPFKIVFVLLWRNKCGEIWTACNHRKKC
jgi:hypothetical protein